MNQKEEALQNAFEINRAVTLLLPPEQGLGKCVKFFGIGFKMEGEYAKALEVFHQGTKNGNDSSARRLARMLFPVNPKRVKCIFKFIRRSRTL